MPAGLGGGGAVYLALETVMGTYVDPSTAGGVWVPIISEELNYTETKYYSPQIRQQTIVSDVQQSYYHVEGNITMEVDVNYMPYFLYASRHLINKTGAAAPFAYTFGPGSQGSATGGSGLNARTMSLTVIRNGIGFGYAGCVVNNWEFTVDNGVLRAVMGILGISEATPAALGTPTWLQPSLFETDYDNMKNNVTRAIKFESVKGGATWALATEGFRIIIRRSSFETYVVGLAGMGDLIMARVTGRNIGLVGADAYTIECKSPVAIT